jgi:hypothetical protein
LWQDVLELKEPALAALAALDAPLQCIALGGGSLKDGELGADGGALSVWPLGIATPAFMLPMPLRAFHSCCFWTKSFKAQPDNATSSTGSNSVVFMRKAPGSKADSGCLARFATACLPRRS